MTTRRTFLQASACAALPGSVYALAAGADSTAPLLPPALRFQAVVVDQHAVAQAFGHRLASQGAPVHTLPGDDVTAVWLEALRPLWRSGPSTIAGLTAPAALFCLERLAWTHDLRVVFHAEHLIGRQGAAVHQVQRGGNAMRLDAHELADAGAHWPVRLAKAVGAHRRDPRQRFGPSVAELLPTTPPGDLFLTSWIITAA